MKQLARIHGTIRCKKELTMKLKFAVIDHNKCEQPENSFAWWDHTRGPCPPSLLVARNISGASRATFPNLFPRRPRDVVQRLNDIPCRNMVGPGSPGSGASAHAMAAELPGARLKENVSLSRLTYEQRQAVVFFLPFSFFEPLR